MQDPNYIGQPEPRQSLQEVRELIKAARTVPSAMRLPNNVANEEMAMEAEPSRPENS